MEENSDLTIIQRLMIDILHKDRQTILNRLAALCCILHDGKLEGKGKAKPPLFSYQKYKNAPFMEVTKKTKCK